MRAVKQAGIKRVILNLKSLGIAACTLGWMGGTAIAQPLANTGTCPELPRQNTPSGENWGQFPQKPNGFATGTMQTPLTPEQSVNCLKVPAGMRAELWASEKTTAPAPVMAYIQHFDFDARGRMWAVEPRSYPNIIRPASGNVTDQKFSGGQDRILIIEDTDGDKVADNVKVFKSGLNLPQSIAVVNGGVVVTMAPYVVYFPNNNDVAGTPVILFSGMGNSGTRWDTHSTISSLMYGLDNWLYGITGWEGCNVSGVNCSQGKVWRFQHTALGHPQTKFELWSSQGPYNAWGVGQTEDGQIFQSGATGTPHINHSIRKGAPAIDIRNGTGTNLYYPITGDRWLWEGSTGKNTQGWFTSSTTAVSGLQLYTSRLLPQKYWSRFAFTCEGASKLCNQDSLVVSGTGDITGSTWRAVRMPGPDRSNIIASTDAWVAPIYAKTGPDGAVWVLDWYSYVFIHNPAEPVGAGNAWETALRAKERVRIYRVTPADGRTEPILNLTNASLAQLVAQLSNPNYHWRINAQRILIGKGYTEELGTLLEGILTASRGVDAVGNDPQVVHALWVLDGLGQFASNAARWNPILKALLKHPAWGARRNVLRVMPRTAASAQAIADGCSVNDTHGHVRLQALVAIQEINPASKPALWDSYRTADGSNGPAATLATAAGVTAAATKPCEPVLDAVVVSARPAPGLQPSNDLRFTLLGDGFRLQSHGSLPSGEITVTGLDGRAVFSSRYDSREGRWTHPEKHGLRQPIYLYRFRGEDGTMLQGRLALAASAF